MMLFLISFLIILAAMLAMAVGVISGGRRIKGSCGGLSQGPGEQTGCGLCGSSCENLGQTEVLGDSGDARFWQNSPKPQSDPGFPLAGNCRDDRR